MSKYWYLLVHVFIVRLLQWWQIWIQSGSYWPQMGQICDIFRSTEIWSEKVTDLSHLQPIWPTSGLNLRPRGKTWSTSDKWGARGRQEMQVEHERCVQISTYCSHNRHNRAQQYICNLALFKQNTTYIRYKSTIFIK